MITLGADAYGFDELNPTLAGENSNATGDLDITTDLTIEGQGVDQTIIDANSIDRVLHMLGNPTVSSCATSRSPAGAAPSGDVGTPGGQHGDERAERRRRR